MKKFIFIFLIFFFVNANGSELKSLEESFKNIKNQGEKSLLLMQRCSAIYGALSAMPPVELNINELETRYKIFLQSAINQAIDNEGSANEEKTYNDQLEIFKSSIIFFIQIFQQNYKKNNSYFKDTWIENDYEMCEKL
jgi:hypothetical protein|tara:strand:- start:70 stop:483 length:414 start_codon:yes stop_codon:yes gene_type:complete